MAQGKDGGEGFFFLSVMLFIPFWWLEVFDMEWIEWGGMRVGDSCAGRERKGKKNKQVEGGGGLIKQRIIIIILERWEAAWSLSDYLSDYSYMAWGAWFCGRRENTKAYSN